MAFDPSSDRLCAFDFTGMGDGPSAEIVSDLALFSNWVNDALEREQCRYGIGGYAENRIIYASKTHFGDGQEARSLHLGTDIWAPAGTAICCPLDARVHSLAFNDAIGDYGATIILEHDAGLPFRYTLYGHLGLSSIERYVPGQIIKAGTTFAWFGAEAENGHWPPHLHFQLIRDMMGREGDFPGVCKPSEKTQWLENCPDPALVLRYTFFSALT